MYTGVYHGSTKHQADLSQVIARSTNGGVERIIITGTNLSESKEALTMAHGNGR